MIRRTGLLLTLVLLSVGLFAPAAWATEATAAPDADVGTVWAVLAIAALLMSAWVLLPIFRRLPKADHSDEEH